MKKIMHFLFLSCLKATELIEKNLHITLSFKEKLQLKMHKSMCKACNTYEKHSIFLEESMKKQNTKPLNINIEELKAEILEKLSEK